MGWLSDRLRKRKQDNLTSAIHGINEEQGNVFNGMHGAAVPGASADGDSSATDDAAVVTTPEGISPATMDGSKGGLRTLHSSMDKNLSLGAFSQTSLTPDIPSSQTADESLRRIQAAPAATSPTEVGTSSSAAGNTVTEPENASQGNVGNNSATVTQGESMNNLEESQNGGQVSVAKKVVSDDLSGMSDADLASRIEKIEQGRERLKGKGVTDEQIDAILGDLHGELNGRKVVKGTDENPAAGKLSGTPGTVVSSGVEKKGGSGDLSNVDNNEETVADATKRPPYEPEPLNSWATTQQGNNLANTNNNSSTTTDPNSTTISTTTGSGANTDLSKSGNNVDVKEREKPKNGDVKPTKKRDDGKAEGDAKTTTTTTSATTNTTNTTTDTGDKGKAASGEVNADAVKKALENPQTTGEKVLGDIIKQSTDDLSKDGKSEPLPTLNERQLTAEQNKKEGDVIKTREQINKEIERLADIKEGDSAELKKLKRERAKLSYQIENMPPFVPEEAVYPDMPKKVKTDVNYKRVLERIEQERKDRGDDPETKAKREKAHRANLVVASISDLLSGAINLWGAAHGAKSLDLKSGVAKLEKKHKDQIDEGLKIAEQETKELEKAMKEDQDYDKAVNDAALAEYKEVLKQLREAVRARNTAGQKQWDAKRAELQKRLESANRRVEEQTKYEHRKAINNQRYGQEMSKIAARGAEQRKTKQTRGAGSTVTHVSNGGSSGAGAGSGGGAPAQ